MTEVSRRRFLELTVSALGAGLLASCAPGAQPTQAPSTQAPSQATQAPAEPTKAPAPVTTGQGLEGKTGVLWGLQYDPHVATYVRLATMFKQKTGAILAVEPQDWPIEAKLIAALAAGTQPDVVCIMGMSCMPLYIQDVLLPLSDVVYNANGIRPEDVLFDDARQAYTWKGEIYGVPTEGGGLGNVVNVPVEDVESLGLAGKYPPTDGTIWWDSHDEMFELARALQIEEGGKVVRWGLSSKGWDGPTYLGIVRSLLDARGTDWWDLTNEKFNIDTEEGVVAMQYFAETPVKLGIETELDQSHVDAALAGKVALARGNAAVSTQAGALGYHFEIAGVPKVVGDKPPLSVSEAGWGFVAPKAAKNPDIAVAFLRFMATEEGQKGYCTIYDGQPCIAWKSLIGKYDHWPNQDPNWPQRKFGEILQKHLLPLARYYGEAAGYMGEVADIVGEFASKVRMKEMTSAEACKGIQERCEAQRKQWLEDMKQYEKK
ncbi:MAG: extracellular solute-binding protein [Anaerolineae bacterium]|nr:extracellular solute-binding protein [Anaerolineae bacterium]